MPHKPSTCMRLVIFACICICTINLNAQTLSPDDLLSPTEISHDIYGYNGEYMMDQCFDSDDPYSNPQLPYTSIYLSSTCKELVDEVSPGILRFPGGITANFYHFYDNGYGFRFSETLGNSIGPVDPSLDNLMPVNFIEPFADLALQTNSKVIFTLNLYTHFRTGGSAVNNFSSTAYLNKLDENMAALQYLTDRGVEIVGIELGNEMYNHVELTGLLNLATAPGEYLAIGQNYSDTIRSRFPGIPIGVPIAIHKGNKNKTWNEQMALADFAEGRVIHEYERIVWNNCDLIADRDEYFACAKRNVEDFFDTDFKLTMEEYMELYPGKELWLTEWGMAQSHKVANTFFDAYYNFKYWNKYMEFEQEYPEAISFALRHNLISSGWSYSAFSQKYDNESTELYYNGNKTIHSSAYAHKLMKDIFDDGHEYIGHTVLDNCDVWVYRDNQGGYKAAVINESTQQKSVDPTEIALQMGLGDMEITRYSMLTADQYHSAAGINYWADTGDLLTNHLDYTTDIIPEDPSLLTAQGLSLNLAHLAVTETEPPVEEDPAIISFDVELGINCSFNIAWSVTDENTLGQYQILAGIDGSTPEPVGTVLPTGAGTAVDYQFNYLPGINGDYTFLVERLEDGIPVTTSTDTTITVDCVPETDPYLVDFRVITEDDCLLKLHWLIGDENDNGNYAIFLDTGADAPRQIGSVASSGYDLIASYEYGFLPVINGEHSFIIRRYENDIPDFNTNQQYREVQCIGAPSTSLTSAAATQSGSCTVDINWEVSNEDGEGHYFVVLGIDNGPMEIIDYVAAQPASETTVYSYSHTPVVNGVHTYRIDRVENGALVFSSNDMTTSVTCIPDPPRFELTTAMEMDCSLLIDWQISNENAAGDYIVFLSVNGSAFEAAGTVSSAGSANTAEYNLSLPIEVNGTYMVQIGRYENGVLLSASDILTAQVDCIEVPHAVITNFTAVMNNQCGVSVDWQAVDQQGGTSYLLYVSNAAEPNTTPVLLAGVQATGGSSQDYSETFTPALDGIYIFQIQVLQNGQAVATYSSGEIEVNCQILPVVDININGNATHDIVEIELMANMFIEAELRIVRTNTGAIVVEETLYLQEGSQSVIYNMDDYPNAANGVYHAIIIWSGGTAYDQFVYAGG